MEAETKIKAKIIGDKKLKVKLGKIEKGLLTREILGKVAAQATTHIKDRTLSGKDKNERAFAEYSESYLEFKLERGGEFFGGNVDLFNGGDMLGAMQPRVKGSHTAEILFTRNSEALKASGHNQGSRKTGLPKREFFSLGPKGAKQAALLLEKHLEKVLGA